MRPDCLMAKGDVFAWLIQRAEVTLKRASVLTCYLFLLLFTTIGNRKVNEKDYAEAIRLYGEAIVLNPKNAVYYANRYENRNH